jgi:hypothetical protein
LIDRVKTAQQTITKQEGKNPGDYADNNLHRPRFIKKLQPLSKTE